MSSIQLRARMTTRDIDMQLDVADGEVVAVLGPNGAGKSTLLSVIAGLLAPDDGAVRLGDRVVTDTAHGIGVPAHARGVALLSQQSMLFPHMTVEANVAFAPRSAGRRRADAHRIARHWLDAVDATSLSDRRPASLSGGQAQRVAIARALAADPTVLLLDEPMAALDVGTAPAIRRLLRTILREQRRTALIVTHDLLDALALADTVVVVEGGRIVERGSVSEVLTSPRSAFGARISGVDLITGTARSDGSLQTPWGDVVHGSASYPVGSHPVGSPIVALFRPASVAVHLDRPRASPRNVIAVRIAEMDVHGTTVRVRAENNPDGTAGIAADVTPAAVAELNLEPGRDVFFVVKSHEVTLHTALDPRIV